MTPAERSLRARIAVHASWANTPDPSARTANARAVMMDRFDRQVDPDGTLPLEERQRRAAHARKVYFTELAFKASRARAAKKAVAR